MNQPDLLNAFNLRRTAQLTHEKARKSEAEVLHRIYFDGVTYDPMKDQDRLTTQIERVFSLMKDSHWRTLSDISFGSRGSEAGVSARLRDLRKDRFGGHLVERRRRGDAKKGVWEYRLVPSWLE